VARFTRARMEKAALRHLERYPTSEAQLQRVLKRRVRRELKRDEEADEAELLGWIPEVVAKCQRLGYLDDARFARDKAKTLRRRGASTRKIRAALKQRGVGGEHIDASLEEEEGDAELQAARAYARRRRFGPWRRDEADAERRRKELAAMARAGFGYGVAKRVLDASE